MSVQIPRGSNMGLRMRDFIEIIIANAHVPVIIDAGIGRPSQACGPATASAL